MDIARGGYVRRRGAKFAVVVDLGRDAQGKRAKVQRGSFTSEREAKKALRAILAGVHPIGTRETFANYLTDEWLPSKAHLRPKTIDQYRWAVDHLITHLGPVQLDKLTPRDIQRLYAKLEQGGWKPRTVMIVARVARMALGDAVKRGYLTRSPAAVVKGPRVEDNPAERVWDLTQARTFLAVAGDHRLSAAFQLLLSTGLRRGELLGLRWKDVDFDEATMRIEQTLITLKGKMIFGPPKTRSSRRTIALGPDSVNSLRQHRKRQVAEQLAVGELYDDHGLVFQTELGQPIDPNNFYNAFRRLVARTGLPQIGIHGLRHTAGTMLLTLRENPKVVSERLGHADVAITLNVYSHVLPEVERAAADKVDKALRG